MCGLVLRGHAPGYRPEQTDSEGPSLDWLRAQGILLDRAPPDPRRLGALEPAESTPGELNILQARNVIPGLWCGWSAPAQQGQDVGKSLVQRRRDLTPCGPNQEGANSG